VPHTSEWEFQGQLISWLNEEINRHGYGFEGATQEFIFGDKKRGDVIVWKLHAAQSAVLEAELKQPHVQLRNVTFRRDAVKKAQWANAPYVALWNIRTLELYRTPARPRLDLLDDDLITALGTVEAIHTVDDWLVPANKDALHQLARELLLTCNDLLTSGQYGGNIIDATVFVESLKSQVRLLRASLAPDVAKALTGKDRKLGTDLREWAEEQGLRSLVEDLSSALAGQMAYRLTGQVLFYYAFRRTEPSLHKIDLGDQEPVSPKLRAYWDHVRTFDYEALFEESILERVPLSEASDSLVRKLVRDLASYNWDSIRVDVLGSIFEQLLPESERITLGQYYTPPRLADMVLSFTLRDDDQNIFDPAVGSGTFLLRAHDRLQRKYSLSHSDILDRLWGGDISAFPAELAVINLCRQDLNSQTNYPRIVVRDFFKLKPGASIELPVAKPMPGGSNTFESDLPSFDAVVGNPPYVRSQQLDDLQPTYKQSLALIAKKAGGVKDAKFDAFAYFILHAEPFLRPGGRLGFVTSAAWLTAEYGGELQKFLVTRLRVRALLFSEVEPFFPYQQVNTVCVIAEKPQTPNAPIGDDELIRFVSLAKPLADLLPEATATTYWGDVDQLVDKMLKQGTGAYNGYHIATRRLADEYDRLINKGDSPRNWARPFRESAIYDAIFGSA
jgi:hypothetical protein